MKEMKTRGAASGSLVAGFPRAKLDSARRVWTVHRPSSCMVDRPPVTHEECLKGNKIKNRLCGDKEKKKTPHQTQPATNTSVNLCDTSGSQGPVACEGSVMQTCTELQIYL